MVAVPVRVLVLALALVAFTAAAGEPDPVKPTLAAEAQAQAQARAQAQAQEDTPSVSPSSPVGPGAHAGHPPPSTPVQLDLRVASPPSLNIKQPEPGQSPPHEVEAAAEKPDHPTDDAGEGPGSSAVLRACWTPQELAGSESELRIRRHLKPDPEPPPPWAVEAAQSAVRPLPDVLAGSIRGVEPSDPAARLIALTFDLCEQANERAGYDGRIVDWLRAHQVKATFFAGGKWMRTHAERATQLMADPLFELGNHGWTHGNLRVIKGEEARDQILWTQAEYEVLRQDLYARSCTLLAGLQEWERIPAWPRVFRFPYGACDQESLELTAHFGLPAIQWTLVTGDPDKGRSAAAIARTVRDGARHHRGAIVVAHANGHGWHTAEALPVFVPQLVEQGYRFVTLSELLSAGTPQAADSCYEVRPGDNLRYDKQFGRGTGG